MSPAGTLALGLVVPCHDEALVIERKLANLLRCEWPAGHAHRVVVVDDASTDGTAEIARRFLERQEPRATSPVVSVVENRGRPGKNSAVRVGLGELASNGRAPELVGISDADVIFEPDALIELAQAFANEPALGLACAAQRFVRDLAADGSCTARGGGPLVDAGGRYDRITAAVRRYESRRGRLFSVHGQLLLWRASLAIAPTPGVAADDIDLMLQVRELGQAIRLVESARFLELKFAPGPSRREQEARRARAYFDALAGRRGAGGSFAARVQWWCYRYLPRFAPLLWHGAFALAALVVGFLFAPLWSLVPLAAWAVLACTPVGRDLNRLLYVVHRAGRSSGERSSSDRWEMARR